MYILELSMTLTYMWVAGVSLVSFAHSFHLVNRYVKSFVQFGMLYLVFLFIKSIHFSVVRQNHMTNIHIVHLNYLVDVLICAAVA